MPEKALFAPDSGDEASEYSDHGSSLSDVNIRQHLGLARGKPARFLLFPNFRFRSAI